MFAERSTAITWPRGRRSSSSAVSRPLPQPASTTVSSPRSGRRARMRAPHVMCGFEMRWYVAASHSATVELPAFVDILGFLSAQPGRRSPRRALSIVAAFFPHPPTPLSRCAGEGGDEKLSLSCGTGEGAGGERGVDALPGRLVDSPGARAGAGDRVRTSEGAAALAETEQPTVLDAVEIERIIPHRYPFLLVDRIIELEPGKRAVGIKNVSMGDWFFQGHFPQYPVMPGVLIVEAMAQVGAVALLMQEEFRGRLAFFAGIDGVRFKRQVKPGDVLRLEIE